MAQAAKHEAQLAWERRWAPAAATAAVIGIITTGVAAGLRLSALADRDDPESTRQRLQAIDGHADAYLAGGVVGGVQILAIGAVLFFLFRATAYRRQEVPPWLLYIVIAAPIMFAVGQVLGTLAELDAADRFLSSGPQTESRAEDIAEDFDGLTIALSSAGSLATAVVLVFVSLNAMRVGLLNRFIGVLGVIVGFLTILPLVPFGVVLVQVTWLGALAALFLGSWPGGRGPAWSTGEPVPWPVPERRGLAQPAQPEQAPTEPEPTPERPASRKRRKRKR